MVWNQTTAAGNNGIGYNDVVRWLYDALFKMNIECDFVWPESDNLDEYKAILFRHSMQHG